MAREAARESGGCGVDADGRDWRPQRRNGSHPLPSALHVADGRSTAKAREGRAGIFRRNDVLRLAAWARASVPWSPILHRSRLAHRWLPGACLLVSGLLLAAW